MEREEIIDVFPEGALLVPEHHSLMPEKFELTPDCFCSAEELAHLMVTGKVRWYLVFGALLQVQELSKVELGSKTRLLRDLMREGERAREKIIHVLKETPEGVDLVWREERKPVILRIQRMVDLRP